MKSHRQTVNLILIILVLGILLAGLTALNYSYVSQNVVLDDFLPRWLGTRLFLMNGWSPYSQDTTDRIQEIAYGRPATDRENQGQFLYPFYSMMLYAPYALISNRIVATSIWMTTLEIFVLLIVLIGISLSSWKPSAWILIVLLLFTLIWYHSVRPVLNGNVAVVVAFFIALSFLAIRSNLDALAGFFLAMASIKPHLVLFLYLFVIIWAIFQKRWTIIWSLLGSLFVLIFATSLLVPDWLIENIKQVISFAETEQIVTPWLVLSNWLPGVGNQFSWLLVGFSLIILIFERRNIREKEFRWFLWTGLLVIVLSSLIGIHISLDNYIIMFPALILILAIWYQRWGIAGRWLILIWLLILSFGYWGLILNQVGSGNQLELNPSIIFFVPIILIIGLYWVRWWALNPSKLPLEEFSNRVE
jgi:hypothetical protein